MKKLAMIVALGVLLSGCEMSYQRYADLKGRCEALGGTPIVFKNQHGVPWKVACNVEKMVFDQGDY